MTKINKTVLGRCCLSYLFKELEFRPYSYTLKGILLYFIKFFFTEVCFLKLNILYNKQHFFPNM